MRDAPAAGGARSGSRHPFLIINRRWLLLQGSHGPINLDRQGIQPNVAGRGEAVSPFRLQPALPDSICGDFPMRMSRLFSETLREECQAAWPAGCRVR